MYKEYFGLKEMPFSIAPDPHYLYMSDNHREALAHLLYGIGEGGGFVQLTGEIGTGKTTLCRCLLEQLPPGVNVALILNPKLTGIELLADMAFRSTFAPDEIGREREVIFEEARIEQDNPRSAIVRQLYGLVFAGNPYGRPVLGTRQTMLAATQERLRAFNRRYYAPDNMTLVVAGPVSLETVRGIVDRTFGRMPATGYKPTPAPVPAPLTGGVRRTVERDAQQAHLALGWQAPRSDDPNADAVDLLTTILAGTESSRLAQRLRDRERLVSSVTMSYAALMGGGIVSLRAELEAKDLERVERIILEELARIQESGPTEEERRLAVTKFEAQHAFDTETSEGLAYAYGLAETTWTLDAELRYVDRLRRITREQIRDAARRYLSRTDYARLAFVPKPGAPPTR